MLNASSFNRGEIAAHFLKASRNGEYLDMPLSLSHQSKQARVSRVYLVVKTTIRKTQHARYICVCLVL